MVLESSLRSPLKEYYENIGYKTYAEVPMLSRKIDLVSAKPDFSEVIAIEMKVQRWKDALQQALAYRIAADRVYVAMWHKYVHRIPIELFQKFGIGILSVNGVVEEKLVAKKSNNIHSTIASDLIGCLNSQQMVLGGENG